MSNVDEETTYVARHSFIAKGSSWSPGVVGDIRDALMFAVNKAKEYGIDTSSDDWLKFAPGDEDVEFYFETKVPAHHIKDPL